MRGAVAAFEQPVYRTQDELGRVLHDRSAAFLYISSASERYGHGTDGDIVASAALEQ